MADEKQAVANLVNPDLQLDLTREPWNLQYGVDGSVVIGRDVVTPGGICPDGGRKNVGVLLNTGTFDSPVGTQPLKLTGDERITSAFGVGWDARAAVYYTGRITNTQRRIGKYHESQDANVKDTLNGTHWEYVHSGHSAGDYVFRGVTGQGTPQFLWGDDPGGEFWPNLCVGDYLHIKSVHSDYTTPVYAATQPFVQGTYRIESRSAHSTDSGEIWIKLETDPTGGVGGNYDGNTLGHYLDYTYSCYPGYFTNAIHRLYGDREDEAYLLSKHVIKNGPLMALEGGWDSDLVGLTINLNEGGRKASSDNAADVQLTITGIATTFETDDTLLFQGADGGGVDMHPDDRFYILSSEMLAKTGVWMTNGRKFWLVRDGYATEFYDLGSDDYLGEEWDGCRIANSRIMWVNTKFPPVIIDLADDPGAEIACAGILPPRCPLDAAEDDTIKNDLDVSNISWRAQEIVAASSGEVDYKSGSPNAFRCKVRMVNLGLGLESDFVNVYNSGASDKSINIKVGATEKGFKVYNTGSPDNAADPHVPPIDRRWTHLEIWRTIVATGEIGDTSPFGNGYEDSDLPTMPFYLETRIPLYFDRHNTELPHEWANEQADVTTLTYPSDLIDEQEGFASIKLSNDDLQALQVAATADHIGNGLPPICQQVASQSGVTVCAGKASIPQCHRKVYSRPIWVMPWESTSFNTVTGVLDESDQLKITMPNLTIGRFDGYEVKDGDQFVILDWGKSESEKTSYDCGGVWDVVSASSNGYELIIQDPTGIRGDTAGVSIAGCLGYIRRPHNVEVPIIESDEEVWYSRTDKFSPESFPKRVLSLSSTGDVFRCLKPVGNYTCVLMASGVHLLYFEGNELRKDTVAAEGQGTPWPKSAVAFGPSLVWAAPDGPKIMTVSNSPDQNGHRGVITQMDPDAKFRNWFRAAFDQGDVIDTGIDTNDNCIRFRRTPYTDGTRTALDYARSQVLQISMTTGLATLLNGDNGVCYVNTHVAEATHAESPKLYSVTAEGQLFETNYRETADVYEGMRVSGEYTGTTLGVDVIVTGTSLTVPDASGVPTFSEIMIGDVIRFDTGNANNGQTRVITGFTDGGGYRTITWETALPVAPELGDKFVIGGNYFKIRFAPFRGQSPRDIVTLDGVWLRALPGLRCGHADWAASPTGKISISAYRNYHNTSVEQNSLVDGVPIYDDDDLTYTYDDRFTPLTADGTAIEIEIECTSARTDFRLESLEPVLRDSADERADNSTAE